MIIKKLQNNRGFVILFAVMISSIILTIALGVANIALKEIKFSTSGKDTNNAFYAAEAGYECALYYDRIKKIFRVGYILDGSEKCAGGGIIPDNSSDPKIWILDISFDPFLSSGTPCAHIEIDKTNTSGYKTVIISKGYNNGTSDEYSATGLPLCKSTNNSIERRLEARY